MFAPPRSEFYTKNDTKSPHFYLLRSKSVPFSNQSIRHIYFIVCVKTYVLTNNIKVNTTMFLSMDFMKLATKTTERATCHRGDLSSIDYY